MRQFELLARRKPRESQRRVRVSCKALGSQRKVWKCKAQGNQRTALEREAQVRCRVLEKSRRLARRTALVRQRTALAKRRRLVTRKVLVQSRGRVKRKENKLMVQDNIVGYPGKDLTYTVLRSKMVKVKEHRQPRGRMGQPVVMRLQLSLQTARLAWAGLAWSGLPKAPLLRCPRGEA